MKFSAWRLWALLGHELDGAAVVQAVGQLDQDHARVVVQREEDPLEILRLEAPGAEVLVLVVQDVLDLGQTVHEAGDLVAEAVAEVVHRIVRILHDVVQEGGGNGLVSQADVVHDDLGHRDGVEHVRLPAAAADILMGLVRKRVGLTDSFQFTGVRAPFRGRCIQHLPVTVDELVIFLGKLGITHSTSLGFRWFACWKA